MELQPLERIELAIGEATTKIGGDLAVHKASLDGLGARLDRLEARGNRIALDPTDEGTNIFKQMAANARVQEFRSGASRGVSFDTPASLRLIRKTLLTSLQDPLAGSPSSSTFGVRPDRLSDIFNFPQRKLTLIDVLPHLPATSNSTEYPQLEDGYQNAAAVQLGEGVQKAEADVRIHIATAAIATVAHFLPMSRQVLDDAPMLSNFIERLLGYGAMLKLENLLVNGAGGADKISGLLANATAFVGTGGLHPVDRIGQSAATLQSLGFNPDVVVMNSMDWFAIRSERDANGRYVTDGWATKIGQSAVYDMQPIATPALAAGTALTLDSSQTAVLDRQSVRTELGYVNNQFIANAITMLTELRAGLAIFAPRGIQAVTLT
jgi:HK97 family phage major capsid protein